MSQENAHNYLKERWNFVKIGMETQNRYKLKVRKSYVAYQYRFLDILESSGGGAKLSHPESEIGLKLLTSIQKRSI